MLRICVTASVRCSQPLITDPPSGPHRFQTQIAQNAKIIRVTMNILEPDMSTTNEVELLRLLIPLAPKQWILDVSMNSDRNGDTEFILCIMHILGLLRLYSKQCLTIELSCTYRELHRKMKPAQNGTVPGRLEERGWRDLGEVEWLSGMADECARWQPRTKKSQSRSTTNNNRSMAITIRA
jgi:hypothetical protein